jgi:tRNA-dihydrouridine synthase
LVAQAQLMAAVVAAVTRWQAQPQYSTQVAQAVTVTTEALLFRVRRHMLQQAEAAAELQQVAQAVTHLQTVTQEKPQAQETRQRQTLVQAVAERQATLLVVLEVAA